MAQAILRSSSSASAATVAADLLWVGSVGGMEADLVARAGLPFQAVHGGGVHGVGWQLPRNVLNLWRGMWAAWRIIGHYQPEVVFVTGGFVTAPVAVAAWLRRVPIVMYLPDIEPGLALQFIGRLAKRIAVTVSDSLAFFPGRAERVVVTGYPTRPELNTATREQAWQQLGLDPQRRTVLITGGSRGARSLNRATYAALPQWLPTLQVIHLTGQLDWPEAEQVRARLPADLQPHYHVQPYLHEMGWALAAADCVVSRAGASCLGDYPLFSLPAILVPYPYAWRYQKVNADYLVQRGAAVRLNDEHLAGQLAALVLELVQDAPRLAAMQQAARALATPNAAQHIAQVLASAKTGVTQP